MARKRSRVIPFVAAFAVFALGHPASAEEISQDYAIRLAGLPIGNAVLNASLSGERYGAKVRADIGWLGIGRRIEGEVSGKRAGQTLIPETFRMSMPGRMPRVVTMQFAGQSVADYEIAPPVTAEEMRGRVPIRENHLKRVLDPLSALMAASLVANRGGDQLCQGETGVFVGFAHFDLALAPKTQTTGSAGPQSVICRVRYKPLTGHRPDDATQKRLAASPDIEVEFRQIRSAWTLARVALPTPAGQLVVQRKSE